MARFQLVFLQPVAEIEQRLPDDPWQDPFEWLEADDRFPAIDLQASTTSEARQEAEDRWEAHHERNLGAGSFGYGLLDLHRDEAIEIMLIIEYWTGQVGAAALQRIFGKASGGVIRIGG